MSIAPDLSDFSKEEICESLGEVRFPYEIAVHSSENYFNMGAIIRTGHSFLCRKYWMVDFDKFYEKAAMGTCKWEKIEKVTLAEFFGAIGTRPIVVFERRKDLKMVDIHTFEYPENPILFFGSEKFGVPDDIVKRAYAVVTIPLYGVHNDLNLSIAAGIATYDFVTKYLYNKRR